MIDIQKITRWVLASFFVCLLLELSLPDNAEANFFSPVKGRIFGVVIDFATKEPLMSANIYIPALNIGTSTDKEGRFELRIDSKVKITVEISFIGYETKEIEIEIMDGEDIELTVYLNSGGLEVGDVTVTGSKITETVFNSSNFVSVTTEEEIKTANYTTTADILKSEPGILVQKTTYAHGAPVIRGLIGKYVLLLYNGVRLNKSTFRFGANQYLNTISAEALSRIEITRGPTSVLYGSDAIGGTINLVTERYAPEGESFHFVPEVRFGTSTADDSRFGTLYLKGGKKTFSFSGSFLYKDVNDLEPGGGEKQQVPTGWKEANGSLNLFYELSETHNLEFNFVNVNQKGVPRYDKYVTGEYQNWTYDPQNRKFFALSYNYSPAMSWLHQIKWNVSYQDEEEGRTLQKTGSQDVTHENDVVKTFGSFVNFSSILQKQHWLNWGLEFYRDKVNSERHKFEEDIFITERPAFPNNSIYNSFGAYLQDSYHINNRLELSAGLRYSRNSFESDLEDIFGMIRDDFDDFTGFASFGFKPEPWVNIIGSYSRGFRAPNLNDTVVLKVSNSGVDAPSPGLKPEISRNIEFGVKINRQGFRGGWFVYYNRMSNLIDRRFGTYKGLSFFDDNGNGANDPSETTPIFQKFNTGTAKILGTEFYVSYRLNPVVISGQTFYTYGENVSENEPMSRIPPLMGNLGLRWNVTEYSWIETNFSFAAKQDRLSERDVLDTRIPLGGTPGYKTLSLKGVLSHSSGRIVLSFENIFDELYKTHGSGIYSPGRHFAFTYQFSPFTANP